jgi:hypothetical protein
MSFFLFMWLQYILATHNLVQQGLILFCKGIRFVKGRAAIFLRDVNIKNSN